MSDPSAESPRRAGVYSEVTESTRGGVQVVPLRVEKAIRLVEVSVHPTYSFPNRTASAGPVLLRALPQLPVTVCWTDQRVPL